MRGDGSPLLSPTLSEEWAPSQILLMVSLRSFPNPPPSSCVSISLYTSPSSLVSRFYSGQTAFLLRRHRFSMRVVFFWSQSPRRLPPWEVCHGVMPSQNFVKRNFVKIGFVNEKHFHLQVAKTRFLTGLCDGTEPAGGVDLCVDWVFDVLSTGSRSMMTTAPCRSDSAPCLISCPTTSWWVACPLRDPCFWWRHCPREGIVFLYLRGQFTDHQAQACVRGSNHRTCLFHFTLTHQS